MNLNTIIEKQLPNIKVLLRAHQFLYSNIRKLCLSCMTKHTLIILGFIFFEFKLVFY